MTRATLNLGLFVLVFVILLAGYGVWYAAVQDLSARAASLSGEIATRQQDSENAASARRALDSIADEEASLASHFVSAGSVVPYLEGLEKTASSLGATIDVGSVSAEDKPRPHLALSLSIKGPFAAVMRTLGTLEYGPVDVEVSRMTLDTVPDAEGAASWTAAVTMSVGMESAAQAATSTPAAPSKTTP
jgi:hypothetical protein